MHPSGGLFEAFDWVLQAQLCLATGKEVFHKLRSHGVRTAFDLERAVLSCGAPPSYVRAVGAILFSKADAEMKRLLKLDDPEHADVEAIRHVVAVVTDDCTCTGCAAFGASW